LDPAERQKKLKELYDEMSSIRIETATGGGTQNPYKIRNVRKAIARILTIQHEEEMEASK
jgi:ribosomal protein L29